MTAAEPLVWALRYIEVYQWSPVPLWTVEECDAGQCPLAPCPPKNRGKHPRIRWQESYLSAVTQDKAREWWQRWPHAGVALLTGKRSGFDAIDIDPANGGNLSELEAKWGSIGGKPTVHTGSGGDHIYVVSPSVPTSNGLADLIGLPGVDYRGDGGLVVAPPTIHYSGRGYQFVDPPPKLVNLGWIEDLAQRRDADQRERDERSAALATQLASSPRVPPSNGEATDTGRNMTRVAVEKVAESHSRSGKPGGRHDTARNQAYWLAGLIPTGHLTEGFITRALYDSAVSVVAGEHRDAEMAEAIRWGIEHGQCKPWEPEERRIDVPRLVGRQRPPEKQPPRAARGLLVDLLAAAREYQDIPDPGHLFCAAAVAATRDLDEEPVWLLLVAAPSSGKTETTRALDDVADDRLDDITAAGLLSWKPGKRAREVGVLTRIPNKAVVTFGDLSSLLADSNSGRRDTTFALLRKAYDGHVARDLGTAPEPLRWEGKLTVIAAVTGIIDHYTAHADALGPRWLYYRLPARNTDERRKASKLARKSGLDAARDKVKQLLSSAVAAARDAITNDDLSKQLDKSIEDAALVTCWGRAAVPRHSYGRREIDGNPSIEEPPRVLRQLRGLARGLIALGVPEVDVIRLTRRAALDSMPLSRRQVLDVLADGELLTTSAVASAAGIHRHVARRQLEELEVIGVVSARRSGAEPGDEEPDRRTALWQLGGEDAVLVAKVINDSKNVEANTSSWWHKNISTYTQPPQTEEKDLQGDTYNFVPPLRSRTVTPP